MMISVGDNDADSRAASEADYAAAAQRFARSALNPLVDRASSQELLDSMSELAEVTDPVTMSGFKLFTGSHAGSVAIRDAVTVALAARDAADKAEPRRLELLERYDTVIATVASCIDGMGALAAARREAQGHAVADGFVITPDGAVSTDEASGPADEHAQTRRARHEHRLMQIHGQEAELQASTVATIRERLGADVPGMPWAVLECARGGHDLAEGFRIGLGFPPSPLTTLMHELVAHAKAAKAAVWPYPDEPDTAPD